MRLSLRGRAVASRIALAIALVATTVTGFRVPALAVGGVTGTIQGTVTDATTKAPLASVDIVAASPSQTSRTKTDARGFFSFAGLPVDTYTVSFTLGSYRAVVTPGVTVQGDGQVNLDTGLTKTLQYDRSDQGCVRPLRRTSPSKRPTPTRSPARSSKRRWAASSTSARRSCSRRCPRSSRPSTARRRSAARPAPRSRTSSTASTTPTRCPRSSRTRSGSTASSRCRSTPARATRPRATPARARSTSWSSAARGPRSARSTPSC